MTDDPWLECRFRLGYAYEEDGRLWAIDVPQDSGFGSIAAFAAEHPEFRHLRKKVADTVPEPRGTWAAQQLQLCFATAAVEARHEPLDAKGMDGRAWYLYDPHLEHIFSSSIVKLITRCCASMSRRCESACTRERPGLDVLRTAYRWPIGGYREGPLQYVRGGDETTAAALFNDVPAELYSRVSRIAPESEDTFFGGSREGRPTWVRADLELADGRRLRVQIPLSGVARRRCTTEEGRAEFLTRYGVKWYRRGQPPVWLQLPSH